MVRKETMQRIIEMTLKEAQYNIYKIALNQWQMAFRKLRKKYLRNKMTKILLKQTEKMAHESFGLVKYGPLNMFGKH